MMSAKYKIGDKVRATVGAALFSAIEGRAGVFDMRPELTEDDATIVRVSDRYSETEPKYEYTLHFEKYGSISWFYEENLLPA